MQDLIHRTIRNEKDIQSFPFPPLPLSFPSFEMTQATHKKNGELSHAMSVPCLQRYNKYIPGKFRKSCFLFFKLVMN